MQVRLSQTQLFRGLEEEEIARLLQCLGTVRRHYEKEAVILAEGAPTEQIGLVLSGRVMISLSDVWGNNSVLGSVGPGECFAEAYACVPEEPLLVHVTAAEESWVLFLNVRRALSPCACACAAHSGLIRQLLALCAGKNLQMARRMQHTTPKTIRGRLLSYFSECVKRSGQYSFTIPYNRQQLADYLSVDRSALCSELSKMRRAGLLHYERNHFDLSSAAGLIE